MTVWDTIQGLVRNPVGGRDSATNVFWSFCAGILFSMQNNTAQERKNLIYFLENGIRDGQYGILITHVYPGSNYHPESWSTDSITIGKRPWRVYWPGLAPGANQLTEGSSYSYPYVFVLKRFWCDWWKYRTIACRPGLHLTFFLVLKCKPSVNHPGPAKNWNKFEWKIQDQRGSNP